MALGVVETEQGERVMATFTAAFTGRLSTYVFRKGARMNFKPGLEQVIGRRYRLIVHQLTKVARLEEV